MLEGKEHEPLRKFQAALELLHLKAKLYLEKYGGDIVEREASFVYNLPEGREEWAGKIEGECRAAMRDFGFIRIHRKATRVKMSWSLAKEVRLLRTLC